METEVKQSGYVQASPCGGVLGYQWDGVSRSMEVAITLRSKQGEEGFGITGGGFAECGLFLNSPVGTIRSLMQEVYRESWEELGAILTAVIPPEVFTRYAQPLDGYLIRTADGNRIHAPAYYAFPFINRERAALADLPDTDERKGPILWMRLTWDQDISEENLLFAISLQYGGDEINLKDFFHQHEVPCMLGMLALTAERGRLWNDRNKE